MDRFDPLVTRALRLPLDYEYWPADDARSNKLLIVLHGRGDSREGFHWLPEALGLEAFHHLFLNAPDPYHTGFSWYDLPPRQGPGIQRSRRLLFEVVAHLQSELGLKSTDLFLFGFSQGCLMATDLALRASRPFGGVVGISGYTYFLEEYPEAFGAAVTLQHLLLTHGVDDEVLPIEASRVGMRALRKLGVPIDWREYEKAHSIDAHREIDDIREFLKRLLECA